MPPIVQEAAGAIVRAALFILAGYLVKAGIWTEDEAARYVGAAALFVLTLGWSLWQKYKSRTKLVTALASPVPMTENQAAAKVSHGTTPSTLTPKDEIPTPAPGET
jgi:hypothetical protein